MPMLVTNASLSYKLWGQDLSFRKGFLKVKIKDKSRDIEQRCAEKILELNLEGLKLDLDHVLE